MRDMIEYPPLSEISDEHPEIGAALFLEAVERDRAWKKANAKNPMPTRKDHDPRLVIPAKSGIQGWRGL